MLETPPSATRHASSPVPDWSRERAERWWEPSRRLIGAVRDYQRAGSRLGRVAAVLRHRFWSAVCSSEVPLTLNAGGGLLMPHPFGIVIHPEAELGVNCLVMQGVTIGTNGKGGLPRLGNGVDVGPGAAILGGVQIGDNAAIGANAVVLSDVPPYGVAVGIPAKVIRIAEPDAAG
ncbi:serine O-acetyltransferase [Parvularcula dongshanensis]|uniref:Serine O-acetyltransferase n=1 Tax=Parvularcula dongshanensis TaxID=1173995 RepID=A0A840I3L9_9PROT|nr:serine O-acetyltransferase [Parvularcula dongshanensis]